jgi:hypothetical protein
VTPPFRRCNPFPNGLQRQFSLLLPPSPPQQHLPRISFAANVPPVRSLTPHEGSLTSELFREKKIHKMFVLPQKNFYLYNTGKSTRRAPRLQTRRKRKKQDYDIISPHPRQVVSDCRPLQYSIWFYLKHIPAKMPSKPPVE